MNFPPPRKSLFWAEKQQSPSTRLIPSELTQIESPGFRPPGDSHSSVPDHNSRFDIPLPSSPDSKSFLLSKTGLEESKSMSDNISSGMLSELSKLDLKSSQSSDRFTGVHKRLQAMVQANVPDMGTNENSRTSPTKRASLSLKKPYMAVSSPKSKIVPVFEDEKEESKDSYSVSEEDQTFTTDNDCSEISDEDEENMDPMRQLRRRKLRRVFYATYFVGIAISLQNRIRLYGTLKPIEEIKSPENEVKVSKTKGFLPLMPSNNFRVAWSIILVFFTILTAIFTPYNVSFIEQDDVTFYYINLAFDVVFGFDMIVSFMSAYYDPINGLVTSFRSIILQYLKTWFWIDLIAIFPFDSIVSAVSSAGGGTTVQGMNKLLRLLRFPRLYRLFKILRLFKMLKLFSTSQIFNKIIKKLNLNVGIIKMVKFVVNITVLNHFVGCFWFFVAKMDDYSPDTWVAKHGLVDADAWTQYLASFYWALQTITTVGFGDFAPGTPLERIIAIIWMIIGVGVYSFTIGNLSSLLANMDRRATLLKKKISTFNNFASKVKLPDFIRKKVQRFFELNHKENVYYWIDPTDMLKHLPENLKSTLLLYSYSPMIKDIEILESNANFTAILLTNLKLLKLEKREILYREGDPSQEIYFISKGSIKMVSDQGQGIYTLVTGTFFGEIEILEDIKRLCFAQACETTIIIVCDKTVFLEALKEFPDIEAKIKKVVKYRKDKLNNRMVQLKEENSMDGVGKANKRPLLKSPDYYYTVLVNDRTKLKNDQSSQPVTPNNNNNKMPIAKNPSNPFPNNQKDHLESFRKLQDFTGVIDAKRSEIRKARTEKGPAPQEVKEDAQNASLSNTIIKEVSKPAQTPFPLETLILRKKKLPPLVRPADLKSGLNVDNKTDDNNNERASEDNGTNVAKSAFLKLFGDNTAKNLFPKVTNSHSPKKENDLSPVESIKTPATANFLDPVVPERKSTGAGPEEIKESETEKKSENRTSGSGEEGDFAKCMKKIEQEENPIVKLRHQNKNDTDQAEYLNLVKDGLDEIKKLREVAELALSGLDIQKKNIIDKFSAIAERQKEVNANVEKLFSLTK